MRWLAVLIIAVGLFFAFENRSTIVATWTDGVKQITGKSGESGSPIRAFQRATGVESWGNRPVAGLTLDLPYDLVSYTPDHPSAPRPNLTEEYFHGGTNTRLVFLKHQTSGVFIGEPMLAWANASIASEAKRLNMDIISQNAVTTVIRGFRTRRIDMTSKLGQVPRKRARMVIYERGPNFWFVQLNTLENDKDGEKIFQRIASSVQ